ncbi:Protein of unknown function, partial [Gryllus bimaculatus]
NRNKWTEDPEKENAILDEVWFQLHELVVLVSRVATEELCQLSFLAPLHLHVLFVITTKCTMFKCPKLLQCLPQKHIFIFDQMNELGIVSMLKVSLNTLSERFLFPSLMVFSTEATKIIFKFSFPIIFFYFRKSQYSSNITLNDAVILNIDSCIKYHTVQIRSM